MWTKPNNNKIQARKNNNICNSNNNKKIPSKIFVCVSCFRMLCAIQINGCNTYAPTRANSLCACCCCCCCSFRTFIHLKLCVVHCAQHRRGKWFSYYYIERYCECLNGFLFIFPIIYLFDSISWMLLYAHTTLSRLVCLFSSSIHFSAFPPQRNDWMLAFQFISEQLFDEMTVVNC